MLFFVLLISFQENIICFGKQSYTQIHYFDIFSRVYLIILTKPMCSNISYIYLATENKNQHYYHLKCYKQTRFEKSNDVLLKPFSRI
jgi:hypothetical protein